MGESELQEAIHAFDARDEAIQYAHDNGECYRMLFVGMDLDVDELLEFSMAYAGSGIEAIGEQMGAEDDAIELNIAGKHGPISVRLYLQGAWLDGFATAAMLFLKRSEGNTR